LKGGNGNEKNPQCICVVVNDGHVIIGVRRRAGATVKYDFRKRDYGCGCDNHYNNGDYGGGGRGNDDRDYGGGKNRIEC
jgi:hypothetical protein